jgi:hypothetical protein
MHPLLAEHLETTYFDEYLGLRRDLVGILGDDDLGFRVGGSSQTLGELCREIGEIEMSYIEGLGTFRQRFDLHHDDDRVEREVAVLGAWWERLDEDLLAAMERLSEDDIRNRRIRRSDFDEAFFSPMPRQELDIYREALLIFYAKVSVYLRAMGRDLPQLWADWIG